MEKQTDRGRHLKIATDISDAMTALWAKPNSRLHRRHTKLQDVEGSAPRVVVWDWNETETVFEPGYDKGQLCVIVWRRTETDPEIIEFLPLDEQSLDDSIMDLALNADSLMNRRSEQWGRVGPREVMNPAWPTAV